MSYQSIPNESEPRSIVTRLASYFLILATLIGADANAELVTNGDFEGGNTGFSSEYQYANVNLTEGEYTIGSDPSNFNPLFTSFGDHTSGSGQMLVVNGDGNPMDRFWFQDIDVIANQRVDVSFYAANTYPVNPANLILDIDGSAISSFDLTGLPLGMWTRFEASFTPLTTGQVTLGMRDANIAVSGNDFAIDDISAVSIPEPSGLLVLGAVTVTMVGIRRRKKSRPN